MMRGCPPCREIRECISFVIRDSKETTLRPDRPPAGFAVAVVIAAHRTAAGRPPSFFYTLCVTITDGVLARAQAGDREAFHELYAAHHASLYRYALGETGLTDDACEVVQETFVRAWGSLGSFRGESSFLHWLFRIARNLIIDLSLIHISEPTRQAESSYAVFC